MDEKEYAFPQAITSGDKAIVRGGMELRDYFAAKALAGMVASPDTTRATPRTYAMDCYAIADAMLAARKNQP